MEKPANTVGKFFGNGLLVLGLILTFSQAFAQTEKRFTYADAAKLLVVPRDDAVFTNQETFFILQIPNAKSADVQVDLPIFPAGVVFNSSRLEDFSFSQFERGVQYEFNFTFEKSGDFSLPSLILYVQGNRYIVKFKPFQVYQNPLTIMPRVVVAFDNGQTFFSDEKSVQKLSLVAGVPECFTVYLQYGTQLQQFAWSIPKDSIFKELKRFEIEASAQKKSGKKNTQEKTDFSTERIPVAYFEWIPLEEGTASLPDIRLMTTAFSGRAVYLSMPECVVEILPHTENADALQGDDLFAYAFTQEKTEEEIPEPPAPDIFELAKIAELRSAERHLFWQAPVRAQRIAAEEKLGIQNAHDEPSIPNFILFASVFVTLAVMVLIGILARKKMFASIAAVFAIIFLFFTVLLSHRVFERCAIVTGGSISPVPEYSALTKTAAGPGSRVLIKEEIDYWYYIEYNESGGWIKKENLVLIK